MTNGRPRPYVAAATFCEVALQEKDNVYSLIRIFDTITVRVAAGKPPLSLQQLTLMVILRSGDATGKYDVRLMLRRPSGEQREVLSAAIEFTGEERGANIRATLQLRVESGLHWVDVLVNGEKLTSVPLRIVLQALEPLPSSPKSESETAE
jgi:hypothetical protein